MKYQQQNNGFIYSYDDIENYKFFKSLEKQHEKVRDDHNENDEVIYIFTQMMEMILSGKICVGVSLCNKSEVNNDSWSRIIWHNPFAIW